jgi:outer membrane protein assembly factor BamE (lipoprotein component of BamABCDE complex)
MLPSMATWRINDLVQLRRGAKMIKTMKLAKTCTVVLLAISLTACATKLGRNFDDRYAQQIKPGETTKQDVRKNLGRPALLSKAGDEETWTYAYYAGKLFYNYSLGFGDEDLETQGQGSQKRLVVTFKGDVVKDSRFAVELPKAN